VFSPFRVWSFHPLFNAVGVAISSKLALRIEQDNQDRTVGHMGLHHQATASLIDEARLREADMPAGTPDQAIAVTEFQCTVA
jgi:hypothetical protein